MTYRVYLYQLFSFCVLISPFASSINEYISNLINKGAQEPSTKPNKLNRSNTQHINWSLTILASIFDKKVDDFYIATPESENQDSTLKLAFKDKETSELYFIEDCSAPDEAGFDLTKLPELLPFAETHKENEKIFLLNAFHCRINNLSHNDKKHSFVDYRDGDNALIELQEQYALLDGSVFHDPKLKHDIELTTRAKEDFYCKNKYFLRDPGSSFLVTKLIKPTFCHACTKSLRKKGEDLTVNDEFNNYVNCDLSKTVKLIDPTPPHLKPSPIVTTCLRNWTISSTESFKTKAVYVKQENCINKNKHNMTNNDDESHKIMSSCFSGLSKRIRLKMHKNQKFQSKSTRYLMCCNGT